MADGARADVFGKLLKQGDLPNISKYIVQKGSYKNAVTVFPSTTGPAYTPYILGKFPGRCNFPGIRWFDKKEFAKTFFSLKRFRSYIGHETYLMNHDISKDHKTIFEIIPDSLSILNELTRGITAGGDKTRYSKIYYKLKSHFTNKTNEVDKVSRRILLANSNRLPEFSFVVYLGIDNYSHLTHPFHKSVLDSYKIIDKSIGELAKSLIKKDILDDTLLLIVSDHGLSQTHSHFDLLEYMNRNGFKTFYYPNIFKNLFNASAANMVSGNSMSNLYFKGKKSWDDFNTDEISDFINQLVQRPEIDILLAKQSNDRIKILSKRGSAKTWIDSENKINYEVMDSDPFGYEALPPVMTIYESLQNTYNTNYPDALVQINQLFESPRTGDIIVTASPGHDLRAKHENPEHRSSHGSLIKDHMLVPIAINTDISKEFIRTVDLFPTILKLLGYELPQLLDGKSLVD